MHAELARRAKQAEVDHDASHRPTDHPLPPSSTLSHPFKSVSSGGCRIAHACLPGPVSSLAHRLHPLAGTLRLGDDVQKDNRKFTVDPISHPISRVTDSFNIEIDL